MWKNIYNDDLQLCIKDYKPVKISGAVVQDAGRPAGTLASVAAVFGIVSVTKSII